MMMEVILRTNAGEKVIAKRFPSLADGEAWVAAMSQNPRFVSGGCDEWHMAVVQ